MGLRSGARSSRGVLRRDRRRVGGGKGKWILAGIAVLAVIAVTVVITVLVVGKDSGNSPNRRRRRTARLRFASANDKGPVTIITEDPTCASTTPILTTLADEEKKGWDAA